MNSKYVIFYISLLVLATICGLLSLFGSMLLSVKIKKTIVSSIFRFKKPSKPKPKPIVIEVVPFDTLSYTVNSKRIRKSIYQYDTCIITRVRNVGDLIPNWISYHSIIGVDKFFISDDCSDDSTLIYLKRYERKGFIKLFTEKHMPFLNCSNSKQHSPLQNLHFQFLFNMTKSICKWIALTDVDEYMFPSSDNVTSINFLSQLIKSSETEQTAVFRMPSYNVSSHGYEIRPNGPIVKNFYHGHFNMHIKSMARSIAVQDWTHAHFPWFYLDNATVSFMSDGIPLKHFAHCPFVHKWEMNLSVPCPTLNPKIRGLSIYLKHFTALSWKDYRDIRAARKKTSANTINLWSINPRLQWLQMNTTTSCPVPSENFRKKIIEVLPDE